MSAVGRKRGRTPDDAETHAASVDTTDDSGNWGPGDHDETEDERAASTEGSPPLDDDDGGDGGEDVDATDESWGLGDHDETEDERAASTEGSPPLDDDDGGDGGEDRDVGESQLPPLVDDDEGDGGGEAGDDVPATVGHGQGEGDHRMVTAAARSMGKKFFLKVGSSTSANIIQEVSSCLDALLQDSAVDFPELADGVSRVNDGFALVCIRKPEDDVIEWETHCDKDGILQIVNSDDAEVYVTAHVIVLFAPLHADGQGLGEDGV